MREQCEHPAHCKALINMDFAGLFISQNKELCETYLGKFPVVFLSLKNVDGLLHLRRPDTVSQS